MKRICILSIALVLMQCVSIKKYNTEISSLHSPDDLQEDVDYAYAKLQKLHPQLYFFTPKEELDIAFDSLKKTINTPMNSMEFYEKLAPVVAKVKEGHLKVYPPHTLRTKKERKVLKKKYKSIPFALYDFEQFEEGVFLTAVREKNDSALLYSQLLQIDSIPVDRLIAESRKFTSSDGNNQTFHKRIYGSRIMRFYANKVGTIDSVTWTLQKNDSIFTKTFKRELKKKHKSTKDSISSSPKDSIHQDTLQTTTDTLTKAERKALRKKQKKELKEKMKRDHRHGYQPDAKIDTREFSIIDSTTSTAFMKIRGFKNGDYEAFYDSCFAQIKRDSIQNLVIDLRFNPGGSVADIHYLSSYLMDEKYSFLAPVEVNSKSTIMKTLTHKNKTFMGNVLVGIGSPFIFVIDKLKTKKEKGTIYLKMKQTKPTEPKENHFTGKIYVLINGMSFSAAATLPAFLDGHDKAFFVGEETGGAYNGTVAGTYKHVFLPNSKIHLPIGLMFIGTSFQDSPHGYGVKPDKEIIPTLEERLAGKDPELEWVLEHIKTSQD